MHEIARPKKEAFLAAYAKCGIITRAAELAKCGRRSHYVWMQEDPDYPERFHAANEEACDHLESEARRRAHEGTSKPVFYKGQVCGVVTEYSDTLMIFLLKAARPDKYRERMDVRQSGNVAILHVVEDEQWFGNAAHALVAQSTPAPSADPAAPGSHEGNGVRPTLGQNGNGTNGRH